MKRIVFFTLLLLLVAALALSAAFAQLAGSGFAGSSGSLTLAPQFGIGTSIDFVAGTLVIVLLLLGAGIELRKAAADNRP